jgi:hypothetical protein
MYQVREALPNPPAAVMWKQSVEVLRRKFLIKIRLITDQSMNWVQCHGRVLGPLLRVFVVTRGVSAEIAEIAEIAETAGNLENTEILETIITPTRIETENEIALETGNETETGIETETETVILFCSDECMVPTQLLIIRPISRRPVVLKEAVILISPIGQGPTTVGINPEYIRAATHLEVTSMDIPVHITVPSTAAIIIAANIAIFLPQQLHQRI